MTSETDDNHDDGFASPPCFMDRNYRAHMKMPKLADPRQAADVRCRAHPASGQRLVCYLWKAGDKLEPGFCIFPGPEKNTETFRHDIAMHVVGTGKVVIIPRTLECRA